MYGFYSSENQETMTLAFLISAHTDPIHLARLLKSLPEDAAFFIHIDSKTDITPFLSLGKDPRVHLLSRRINVMWGSIRQVEYQMELLREALSSGTFHRLIAISGLDYPLWSNARIIEFFSRLGDKEILQGIRMTHQGAAAVNYRRYRWLNGHPWKAGSFPNKLRVALQRLTYGIGIRKPLSFRLQGIEYQLYKGASWWAISPELAAYVLHEWDTNKALVKYFSTAFCPDETFIQTIAFNSPFASRCMLQEGRYTSLSALTPLTYIDYHPVIKVLTEEDWPALKQSGKMFCRKTVTGISDRLLDRIDRERNI